MKRKIPTKNVAKAASAFPHYIGYLRVSKDHDTTGSFTFETQEQRITQCLDQRCGRGKYTIEFLSDDGLSGGYGLTATGVQPKTRPTLQLIADKVRAN